jgi:competence protein ComGC
MSLPSPIHSGYDASLTSSLRNLSLPSLDHPLITHVAFAAMNKPPRSQGFTRKELLVSFVIVSCLAFYLVRSISQHELRGKTKTAALTARGIHSLLVAWAQDHNGNFPAAPQSSNEAFRELFKAGLVDSEPSFAIPRDAWHKKSPSGNGKGPDNLIGTAPDFPQALMPGECAFAYVSGLSDKSSPQLPILANGFSESLGVYSKDPSHKGGVFKGGTCAWVTVGGSAQAVDLSPDFRVMDTKNGKKTDVFSPEWGTKPDNIKNPAG